MRNSSSSSARNPGDTNREDLWDHRKSYPIIEEYHPRNLAISRALLSRGPNGGVSGRSACFVTAVPAPGEGNVSSTYRSILPEFPDIASNSLSGYPSARTELSNEQMNRSDSYPSASGRLTVR